jgi:hypothetical protein
MDGSTFDALTRILGVARSRRGALAGLATALGMAELLRWESDARTGGRKKKRKPRKKRRTPLQFNAFGCLNVGSPCRGNDELCCSGLCEGKAPRKGKRDRSRCIAHGERGCLAGQMLTGCGGSTVPCTTITGQQGACQTTTGGAGYCTGDGQCRACRKDADCRAFCGPEAACILCPAAVCVQGTQCVGPVDDGCVFPPP